jgi:hypothetical protein
VGDRSPVALSKVGETPQSAFPTQIDIIATLYIDGEPVAARMENQTKPRILPQMTLKESQMKVRVESRERSLLLIKHVEKRIQKGALATTRRRSGDAQTVPRYVLYRSDESVVLSKSEEDAEQILRVMEKDWEKIRRQIENSPGNEETIEQPSVLLKMDMDVNADINVAFVDARPETQVPGARGATRSSPIPARQRSAKRSLHR